MKPEWPHLARLPGFLPAAAAALTLVLAGCSIVESGTLGLDAPSMQLQVGPPPPPPTFITVVNEDGVKLVDQEVPRSGLITANPAGEQMTGELTVIVRTAGRGESTTTIDVGENERLEIDVDRDTATVTDVRKVPVASTADTDDSNVAGD